jgi:hypothetical protein
MPVEVVFDWLEDEIERRRVAMIVRCVDNTLQRGVLVLGREYEVHAERDNCYIPSGFNKGFSKTRFEIVSNGPCQPQRRGDQRSRDTLSNDDFRATAFGAKRPLVRPIT